MNRLLFLITLLLVVFTTRICAFEVDLIIHNGNLLTMDAEQPYAEAMAVENGKIIMVGSDEEVLGAFSNIETSIDARGATVVPGFNDAHLHPREVYPENHILGTVNIGPGAVSTIEEVVEKLRAKAALVPEGQWIFGGRYEDTKLGRHPTRYDLDRASKKHPISIRHSSGHVSSFNSYALEAAGVTADTPDPDGGAFDRDGHGTPNGVCREKAGSIIWRAGPKPPIASEEEKLAAIQRCLDQYITNGITSIQDAAASPKKLARFQKLRALGNPIRVSLMIRDRYMDEIESMGIMQGLVMTTCEYLPLKCSMETLCLEEHVG
jgi:predicted amidohydrolase YtcJ